MQHRLAQWRALRAAMAVAVTGGIMIVGATTAMAASTVLPCFATKTMPKSRDGTWNSSKVRRSLLSRRQLNPVNTMFSAP